MGTLFSDTTQVVQVDAGRFSARVDPRWNLLPLPQGGIVTALALRAMTAALDDPTQRLRTSHGTFAAWLDAHVMDGKVVRDKAGWVKLFKKTFRFTGGEITNEFLMSLGYLPGTHREDCPVFARIARLNPPWRNLPGRSKA